MAGRAPRTSLASVASSASSMAVAVMSDSTSSAILSSGHTLTKNLSQFFEDDMSNNSTESLNHDMCATSTTFGRQVSAIPEVLRIGFRGRLYRILQSTGFTVAIAIVILTNVGLMIVETDQNAPCASHANMKECENEAYEMMNHVFLGIYTLEVIFRVYVFRFPLICTPWNMLDIVVVVTGYMDVVMRKVAVDDMPGPSMSLLRILRVLRLLRAVRFVRKIPELHAMLRGFVSAMQSMFWGLVMVFGVMVIFAIVCVELINPLSVDLHQDNEYCKEAFGNIWYCILLLFQTLVAGDSWGTCILPVVKAHWWTFGIFGVALACVQLGFLSLILAVIVQRASQAAVEDDDEVRREKKRREQKASDKLVTLFASIDEDMSGTISLDELLAGFDCNEEMNNLFSSLDMNRSDVILLFELMDTEDGGELKYEYMIDNMKAALRGTDQMSLRMIRLQVLETARYLKVIRRGSTGGRSSATGGAQPAAKSRDSTSEVSESEVLMPSEFSRQTPLPSAAASIQVSRASKSEEERKLQSESSRIGCDHTDPQGAWGEEISAFRARLDGELMQIRSSMAKMNDSVLLACQASFAYQSSSIEGIQCIIQEHLMRPMEVGLCSAASKPPPGIEAGLRSTASKSSSEVECMTKMSRSDQIAEEHRSAVTDQPDLSLTLEVTDSSLASEVNPQAHAPCGQSIGSVSFSGSKHTDRGRAATSGELSSWVGPCTPRRE